MLLAHLASMTVLAVAVSLDSIGVGITYGIRKIRIPFLSVFIIACCSGAIIAVSMQAGVWLTSYINPEIASYVGASILVLIGLWALYQSYRGMDESRSEQGEIIKRKEATIKQVPEHTVTNQTTTTAELLTIELKRLGLVIQILRKPQTADFDDSGIISSSEAIMLGIALSLDALGAGLGAALLGLHAIYTPIFIALCSAVFLIGGTKLGLKLAHVPFIRYVSSLPGVMLIVLGIIKYF